VTSPAALLARSRLIAVVGMSSHPEKEAHQVPVQLLRHGWTIIPVNPHAATIAGQRVYRKLADIPVPVDLVNVFRPSAQAADVVRQAADIGAPAVWLQLGIVSAEGRAIAESAGMDYVEDTCVAVVRAAYEVAGPTP
jgi:hypothetical protein